MKMQRVERNPEFVPGNGRGGDGHMMMMEAPGRVRSRIEGQEDRHKRSSKSSSRHTKRSPSERRFKCDQMGCDRMFFTRKDVKRHMVVHTGVRNFACPFCQQRFGRKDHLVRHAKKSHNRDTRSCATSFAHGATTNRKSNPSVFKSSPAQPSCSSGMMTQMFPHVPTPSTTIAHPAAVHHHHHLNNHLNYGSNGQNESQLMLLTSSGSSAASTSYMSHNLTPLTETAQFPSSLMHHENHDVPPLPTASSSVHQHHQLTKVTSCDATGHFFSFSMPPLSSFADPHSLMPGCFTAPSSSRSLYTTPGPSHHHHFASAAHHGMSVPGHHPPHHHPSEPSAFSMDFNPQLPHFNQAFQQ